MSQSKETGYLICKTGRRLHRMPTASGGRSNVSIPVRCSKGRPHALNHVHPSGNLTLSEKDIKAARVHNIPHVCVEDGTRTRIKCYRVKPE